MNPWNRFTSATSRLFNWIRPHPEDFEHTDWLRIIPLLLLHAACLLVFVVGVSPIAIAVAIALYFIRMFGITGGYHRYFSHRSFATSRAGQLMLAIIGSSSVQRGPLWWAAHHRHHHRHHDADGAALPGRR